MFCSYHFPALILVFGVFTYFYSKRQIDAFLFFDLPLFYCKVPVPRADKK